MSFQDAAVGQNLQHCSNAQNNTTINNNNTTTGFEYDAHFLI